MAIPRDHPRQGGTEYLRFADNNLMETQILKMMALHTAMVPVTGKIHCGICHAMVKIG
jgi:hypothetical protein